MLRAATNGDATFISRVVVASWQDTYSNFLPSALLASLDQNPHHDIHCWEHRIGEPCSATWIISDDGSDVGVLRMTVGASSVPGTDAQLTTLYLLSQARGRGLGSLAVAFARAEALRRTASCLGVCVLEGNKAGQRFYQRQGARRIGERVCFCLDDQPIMEILYLFGSA
jgi:ribosomal protein S18 acetylase RimI-like enzyme